MAWPEEVERSLHKGIYVATLRDMADALSKGIKSEKHRLPAYVLRAVVLQLLDDWEERALPVEEHERVQRKLRPLFENVLKAIKSDASQRKMVAFLNDLVAASAKL